MVSSRKKKVEATPEAEPILAWALTRDRAAYVIVELTIVGDKVVNISKSDSNRQTVQLQKLEDRMLKQAHDGL